MKRIIALALALMLVFGVSFALYEPDSIKNAAQETAEDEWVGYFFSLKPFDGRRYAEKTGGDYDFGVPGVPVFLTITAFEPDDPDYEEGSEFNYSVGAAVSDEVDSRGLHVYASDDGSRYEIGGDINLDAKNRVALYECYVYRTSAGAYYAECRKLDGMKSAYSGPGFGLSQTRSAEWSGNWAANGKKQSQSVKVSISLVERIATEEGEFVWLDGEKNVLAREEYTAGAIPETLAAPDGAALLIVTKVQGRAAGSGTVEREIYTAANEARTVLLYVPSEKSGLLRRCDVSIDWGEKNG